jgi:hypothetical protein
MAAQNLGDGKTIHRACGLKSQSDGEDAPEDLLSKPVRPGATN